MKYNIPIEWNDDADSCIIEITFIKNDEMIDIKMIGGKILKNKNLKLDYYDIIKVED